MCLPFFRSPFRPHRPPASAAHLAAVRLRFFPHNRWCILMQRSLLRGWLGLLLLAVLVLAGCEQAGLPTEFEPEQPIDGLTAASAGQEGDVIPGQYIVVFRDHVTNASALAQTLVRTNGGVMRVRYSNVISGFAANLSERAVQKLRSHPDVAFIEPDRVVTVAGTQTGATWGLDRIDQRSRPTDGTYTYDATGAGVTAYIIDTGLNYGHADFGGRASFGFDAFAGNGADCNGHGTHVGGTVAGNAYGVAKGASLVAVRVLDCNGSGSTSGVIAGVDWVTQNARKPAVANMSLGGSASTALDNAVRNSIAAGVTYAIAAGNSNRNACNYSPARTAEALTVGATDNADRRASFSNYGACVDLFAPGVNITSAWYTSASATNTISGTSMAAPHVAGAAALYLEQNPGATPAQVGQALYDATTKDIVTSSSSANNHLLYTLWGGSPPPPPPPANNAPTAAFTFSCIYLDCTFTDQSSDSDGTIATRSWTFGDAGTSAAANPSHSYAQAGTYTVKLTVTDDDGATASAQQQVTVQAPPSGNIALSVGKRTWWRYSIADLTWTGAQSANVDVYTNGALSGTTANTGTASVNLGWRARGTFTFKVCEAGTSVCSNEASVTF